VGRPAIEDYEDRDPRKGRSRRRARAKPSDPAAGGPGRVGRLGLGRVLRWALGLAVAGAVAAAAALTGLFLYYGSDPKLPNLRALADYRPKQVTRIVDRDGRVIGEMGIEKRTFIPFAEIPKVLVNAVIAAEDADYFNHAGLDYRGMVRAFIENVLRGRTAQGGSTITQQVVKMLVLTPERTLRRKVQEIILARQLSQKLSKEEVLALYLNQIPYGHGRYGCEEAARYYFGKSVRRIDLSEAALLAGLPQSPARLSPRKHPEAAKTRQRYVLGRMAEAGFIDGATAEKIAAEPIRLSQDPFPAASGAPEVIDTVARFLIDKHGAARAAELGTTVVTTIDARLQELARQSLERGLEDADARQGFRGPSGHLAGKALEKRRAALAAAHKGGVKESEIVEGIVERVDVDEGKLIVDLGGTLGAVDLALENRYAAGPKPLAQRFSRGDLVRVRLAPERGAGRGDAAAGPRPLALELGAQAAMVVMNPQTREILALVGGYGFRQGGFDRSRRARRQPGSAWKPFVYAAAIESGRFTAASIVNDAPEVYDLWKPSNYEKEAFRGPVRLRTALAHSINTVAIKLTAEVGLPAVRDLAMRAGITSPLPEEVGLSLALGSAVVTPLELANAYATFAAGGERAEPVLVRRVGDEAAPAAPPPVPGIRADVAYVVVSLMKSVVEEGTARAAAARLRRPAAGKTGTSNDQRDAWFAGFTPELLAVVWVGFDDMKKLGKGEAGGKTALPIWTDFMAKALAGRPARDFVQPADVVVHRIDKATGLLAAGGSATANTDGIDEVFLPGTAPTAVAPAAGEEANPDKLLLDRDD